MSNLNPPKVDTPQQNVSKESKESFTVESHIPLGVVATNISEDGEHNFWRISSVQKKSQAEKIGIKVNILSLDALSNWLNTYENY